MNSGMAGLMLTMRANSEQVKVALATESAPQKTTQKISRIPRGTQLADS